VLITAEKKLARKKRGSESIRCTLEGGGVRRKRGSWGSQRKRYFVTTSRRETFGLTRGEKAPMKAGVQATAPALKSHLSVDVLGKKMGVNAAQNSSRAHERQLTMHFILRAKKDVKKAKKSFGTIINTDKTLRWEGGLSQMN